jgi:two-component system sensor histidine kinase QseC
MFSSERFRPSLRGRLALSMSIGTLAVLCLAFFVLHVLIRDEIYAHVDQDLLTRMRGVADYAVAHPGSESITEFMPQFRTRAHQDFFQIWDASGQVLARSNSSVGRDLPRLEPVAHGPTYHDLVLPDGHRGRAISEIFVLPAGDPRREMLVVTAEETERIARLEMRIHVALLVAALATIAAMLAIMRYSVVRGLRPLDEFAQSLSALDPEQPGKPVDPNGLPVELRPVAASFSALLERLLEGWARERRYSRNVAHELRNPLAAIRLQTDSASKQRDVEAVQATIAQISTSVVEMEQIVDSLMALGRYEAGLETPQLEPVELCATLRRQVESMKTAADHKGLRVALDVPAEVWVHTDAALVRQLVANLLGNAIAHGPAGTSVRVKLTPSGHLELVNAAPHLVAEDIPKLGERFFRISTGSNGSHAGLGLSLAKAIAKVLQLDLDFRLHADASLVATVGGFRTLT